MKVNSLNWRALIVCIALIVLLHCKAGTKDLGVSSTPFKLTAKFVKGADIGWLTQMEASGYKFFTRKGVQKDCLQILKEEGINLVRLRVWVDPKGGWCNTADVLSKALRAKTSSLRVMVDFHYSDSWADPGKQYKPAAWVGKDTTALLALLATHTKQVLTTLQAAGVHPEWVQVGNETNDGMLWEEGRASTHMQYFAKLVQAGYAAVKSVDPKIKVIVHISNGYNNKLFRYIFDGLRTAGANFDIIGMSLYPSSTNWRTYNAECQANMNDMVSRYNKQVMICEVGMDVSDSVSCNAFLSDIIKRTADVAAGNGLGVFYWEPECYNNWQGYRFGAFDSEGKPTVAMDAFR